MSHIPSSAMPHAKPHEEHDDAPEHPVAESRAAGPSWGLVAAVAGGVIALGATAAAAVPLLRGRAAPKRERRQRRKKG